MDRPIHRSRLAVVVGLTLVSTGMCMETLAAQPFVTSAKATHKGEKFEIIGKDEKSGRMVFFSQSKAIDQETRGKGLYNGSSRTSSAHWDLTNGYGTGTGFSRTEKAGGSILVEWTGVCYPANGPDSKTTPHCSGGWFVVPGSASGPFTGLTGGGTWTGSVTADGSFTEEWTGLMEQ